MSLLLKNDADFKRYSDNMDKVKVVCKRCGHRAIIPAWVDKQLCSWCKHYVFRDPKKEFEYRVKERMMK